MDGDGRSAYIRLCRSVCAQGIVCLFFFFFLFLAECRRLGQFLRCIMPLTFFLVSRQYNVLLNDVCLFCPPSFWICVPFSFVNVNARRCLSPIIVSLSSRVFFVSLSSQVGLCSLSTFLFLSPCHCFLSVSASEFLSGCHSSLWSTLCQQPLLFSSLSSFHVCVVSLSSSMCIRHHANLPCLSFVCLRCNGDVASSSLPFCFCFLP